MSATYKDLQWRKQTASFWELIKMVCKNLRMFWMICW